MALSLRHLGLTLIVLAFLMPGHFLPWASFQNQWVAAFGAAFIGLGAAVASGQSGQRLVVQPLQALFLVCAAIPPLQWAVGQLGFVSDALLPSAYWIALALGMLAGAQWAQHGRSAWLDALFAAFMVASGLSVALALVQWLSIDIGQLWVASIPPGARPFANLGQPNHLALLLVLGAVGALRAHARHSIRGATASLLLGWIGLGLVMTQSRTGWLMVALLAAWWWVQRRQLPQIPASRILTGAALFAVVVLSWDAVNEFLGLVRLNTLEDRLQAGPRQVIWQAMLKAIEHSPWVGYGFNQVVLGQQAVAIDAAPVQRMLESAHNLLLDAALWTGVPFALTLTLALGAWLYARVRDCQGLDDWSVLAATCAILTHSMFEFPLEHAFFLLPFGLLLGSFAGNTARSVRRPVEWLLALPVLAMTVLLFAIGSEYLRVESANRSVRLALSGFVGATPADSAPPDVQLLDGPREYHRLMLTEAREGMSRSELDWMQRVTQRFAFPPAMLRYALAAGLNGREAEAALTLKRLCAMHSPQRCGETRDAWQAAQQRWPVLVGIAAP